MKRTVLGAASVEAKKFGVKTGMQIWEAKKICPQIILVAGDSDKYLETTKRFLNILKDYSPYLEVFSIDEVFMEVTGIRQQATDQIIDLAQTIKKRIQTEVGEYITCSIGISYNKLMAKLAGSLYKPDGLVVIADEQAAQFILDRVELDDICGIGSRIKRRLNNMGVFGFKTLRQVPLKALLSSFKSYGQTLYNMAREVDHSPIIPFYEKEEVKSIGHRHTIDHDTNDTVEIKQILLKLTELIARRLRAKGLVGKTVSCWYRLAFNPVNSMNSRGLNVFNPRGWIDSNPGFSGNGMQNTIVYTSDGLEIFQAAWKIFNRMWNKEKIRMIGVSLSNLKPKLPTIISFLPEVQRQEKIVKTLDQINDKFGEFTLQRGILLGSADLKRKPNPFLSDRRFNL